MGLRAIILMWVCFGWGLPALAAAPPLSLSEAMLLALKHNPALAAMFGSWVITLDPIFSGLAWSFIFGLFASTAFSLVVVPVIFYLQASRQEKLRGGPGDFSKVKDPRPPLKRPPHPL